MKMIKLPPKFLSHKYFAMMTLLLFPTMNSKSGFDRKYLPEVTQYLDEILICSYDIFKENNIRKRHQFFAEPLIQFLWSELFTKSKPEIIINHLRRVRSHPLNGEYRYQMILNDMLRLEQ